MLKTAFLFVSLVATPVRCMPPYKNFALGPAINLEGNVNKIGNVGAHGSNVSSTGQVPFSYTASVGGGCPGKNELGSVTGKSVEQCASLCDGDASCVSFEHRASDNRCQRSTSCTKSESSYPDWNLYVRTKPSSPVPEGYCKLAGNGCAGANELGVFKGYSVPTCTALCNSHGSACMSFELRPGDGTCQLSTSCNAQSSTFGAFPAWDLYVRLDSCPSPPPSPPAPPPPSAPPPPLPPMMPLIDEAKLQDSSICFTLKTTQQTTLMFPISKMPATHPSVTQPGTGTKLEAGDPIPVKSCAQYRASKGQNSCGTKLYSQTAPQLFYAYGFPKANTGNPGYYAADAASLYPIVDAEANVYLVLTLDEPEKGKDVTRFAMKVSSSGIPAGTVKVALMDDDSERCLDATVCENGQKNTAAWDETSAAGTFYWKWVASAGDGMALGPIPLSGWTMTFTSLKVEGDGMTKMLVGGHVPSKNGVAFTSVGMAELDAGVTLSGQSAAAACEGLSATQCVMAACCTYCENKLYAVGTCFPVVSVDACNGDVSSAGSCSDKCNAFDDDRLGCMTAEFCGYCDKTNRCITGKPGLACEPCDEDYAGDDYIAGWPHEGAGAVWRLGSGEFSGEILTPPDGSSGDYFGYSMAISGENVVVGAYGDDDRGGNSGSAYLYKVDGAFAAKLTAPDGSSADYFGYSVAISGENVVVGAKHNDDHGGSSGSAYLYKVDGAFAAKLTAPDGSFADYFGVSVAISGENVVVGAYGDDDPSLSGSAYLYKVDGAFAAKLTAPDGYMYDKFGYSVAISGENVVVGAYGDDFTGSAYVYKVDGAFAAKLTAPDGYMSDKFGYSVAISGENVVVGAYGDDDRGGSSGSAYVYKVDGAFAAKLTAPDGSTSDYFGYKGVAISESLVVVGAYGDDDRGSNSGSAYVYKVDGAFAAKLTAPDGSSGDYFGYSVAISGENVVVGAKEKGSAYIY